MSSYEKKQFIYKSILAIVFVSCITVVITVYATYNCMEANFFGITEKLTEDSNKSIDTIGETLSNYRALINEYYRGDVDEKKLLDETIKGYINGLDDEYSEYMTAEEWSEYQESAFGNYVGIGIYMGQDKDGNIVVIEPIEDSPAENIGIQSNDIIVEVNGESVSGMNTSDVANKVKGEEGTMVNIKILRDGEYMSFDVERKEIKIYHVTNKMLENNIGYIKLLTFDQGTSEQFKSAFEELKENGAQKLIIDLRDNTGGYVDEALAIAEMIIPKGEKMLITIDSKDRRTENVAKQDPIIDMDIVVLTNEYSASASEILTGTLRDNGKAKSVGTKTYGKGVIQNIFSMAGGGKLKLTIAEYFTPNETKINNIGINPDFEVEDIDDEENIDEQLNKAIEVINQN